MSRAVVVSEDVRPAAGPRALHVRPWIRWFYMAVALALLAQVIRGFWPSYFGPLLGGSLASRPWIVHVHGVVFSGWMLLLLAQVGLAATGRTRMHRRVGSAGIAYGALVLAVGLIVTFVAPVLHVRAGEWTLDRAAGFVILPLVDMVLFGGFFGAAVAYRRRPDVHKRLILAATVALAFAAVARMGFQSLAVFWMVWLAPLLVGVAFDVCTRRRVHAVYVVSVLVMSVAFLRVLLIESDAWLRIGRALLAPFV